METLTEDCRGDMHLLQKHLTRADAFRCLVSGLNNPMNLTDPPTTTDEMVRTFLMEQSFKFSRNEGESPQDYRERIALFVSAYNVDFKGYIDSRVKPPNARLRSGLRNKIEHVNRLLKYALKHKLSGATKEMCQQLDIGKWAYADLEKNPGETKEIFDWTMMADVPEFLSKVKEIVIEAQMHMIKSYENNVQTVTKLPIGDMLKRMREGSLDTSVIKQSGYAPSMEPVVNEMELNCPFHDGLICDTCSGKVCSVCFCEDEPCAACQTKTCNYSFSKFIEVFTANKGCSETTPLKIDLINGFHDYHVKLSTYVPHEDSQAPFRVSTCCNNITLQPDHSPVHATPPVTFKYLRHSLLQTLSASSDGFSMA